MIRTVIKSLLICALLTACVPNHEGPQTVTIMTFNVENLFDNEDDPGKDDQTYRAIEDKQTAAHKNACTAIEVPRSSKRPISCW